jgi:hypothetical protein
MLRRRVMIASDVGRAVVLGALVLGAASGRLRMAHLYAGGAAFGSLGLLFDLAYRSYLPSIVEREDLVRANSRLQMSESGAEIGGPAAGGLLMQTLGAASALAADAASFVVSASSIVLIRKREERAAPVPGSRLRHEIREGLAAVAHDPLLRALAACTAAHSFFGGFFAALYAIFGIRVLGLPVVVVGLTVGAGGVGSLAGAAVARRVIASLRVGRAIISGRLVHGVLALLIPLAAGPASLAAGMLFLAQALGDPAWAIFDIGELSVRQAVAPPAALGRVNAAFHVLRAGLGPVGSLASGMLAQAVGVRTTLLLAALGMTLSTLFVIASPVRRLRTVT